MRAFATAVALATVPQTLAAFQGFNYASTFSTSAAKQQSDFEAEFKVAQGLVGAPGTFSSARLYTTVQAGTANDPIAAIPAAISTKTSLLLGLWASAGDASFSNELTALKKAISQYGNDLGPLVAGISIGSEDLYRISPTGLLNKENPGVGPDVLVNYIKQVRDAIANTPLAKAPIGHVDTWTAWVNGSNKAAIDAVDWLGFDGYPYFEDTHANSIENGKQLFQDSYDATVAAAAGKPVWVTETGFPVSGKTVGQAVASADNAKKYWQDVGCALFGKTNVWWYTLHDSDPTTPNPSFGIVGPSLSTTPLFDLSCSAVSSSSSSSSSASTSSASSSVSSSAATSTGGGASAGTTTTGAATGSQTTTSVSSLLNGGSPGATINSQQLSLETKTSAAATGTGSQAPVSSSAGNGGAGGVGGNNTTVANSTPTPTSSAASVPTNAGVPLTGSFMTAALGAVAAAFVAL